LQSFPLISSSSPSLTYICAVVRVRWCVWHSHSQRQLRAEHTARPAEGQRDARAQPGRRGHHVRLSPLPRTCCPLVRPLLLRIHIS
jgi:hypothetical protein